MTHKPDIATTHVLLNKERRFNVRSFGVLLAIAGLLILFIALAEDVVEREPMRFDTPLLLWLHSHATPFFDNTMLALTWVGGIRVLVLGLILAALVAWRGQRLWGGFLLSTLVGTSVLNVVAKVIFHRARPDLWLSLSPEYDYGFPSGHSMLSSAFVMAWLVLVWKSDFSSFTKWATTCAGGVFVLGVGISRLYLGVHYPSDVFAGWALSGAWVALLHEGFFRRRPLRSWKSGQISETI